LDNAPKFNGGLNPDKLTKTLPLTIVL